MILHTNGNGTVRRSILGAMQTRPVKAITLSQADVMQMVRADPGKLSEWLKQAVLPHFDPNAP